MDLGQRIRQLREKRNLKQLNLANALQISVQAVSKWERNENFPDIVTLIKLARVLGTSTDYLLGVNEEEPGMLEATVLCSSINDFARKSKTMTSREVADWANVIFHHLTESVLEYDGVPIKYVGDGFLCFFSGAQHAERALKAAVHAKRIIQNDALMITLNTGDVYFGTIGHPDYSMRDICGETVNTAFLVLDWVAQHCPSGIAITDQTHQQIVENHRFKAHIAKRIKKINSTLTIYEVTGTKREGE